MKPKVLIGAVVRRTMLVSTVSSLLKLINNDRYDCEILFQDGAYVHENRNDIAKAALAGKYSHIFFIDHDMSLEPETIEKLLDNDKDIIAADYNYRFLPLKSMIIEKDKPRDRPFKCDYVPMGCTLIKTSILNHLEYPYFFYGYSGGEMKVTEDMYFCQQAIGKGFEVWCNPTILIRHCGDYYY